jgi:hypothetical protein
VLHWPGPNDDDYELHEVDLTQAISGGCESLPRCPFDVFLARSLYHKPLPYAQEVFWEKKI